MHTRKYNLNRRAIALGVVLAHSPLVVLAQDEPAIEEIMVTGSQIRGAQISGALPVTVLNFADIDALGVDGGDELLENIVENGMNFFNE
ncbi:MAG: hypothetical protein OSB72_10720, partial [Gammaproteobacteria bacterium]|nr:hypothetical protein [Gammaproteobacteria bacterium]